MANNIPNITITAPVIQLKNDAYLIDGQYAPRNLLIPCGVNAWVDDTQHWCIPIKDFGICTNIFFEPAVGSYPPGTPPTPDSLLVLRVRDKYEPGFTWWVICTIAQYYGSCQTCCGSSYIQIPAPVLPEIVPCQLICDSVDANGNFISVFGYPVDAGNFHAYGQYQGSILPKQTSATIGGLVTLLNANWSHIGSPATVFTYTAANGVLTATGGISGDSICILITSDTSP
jgi:hypothetical protein